MTDLNKELAKAKANFERAHEGSIDHQIKEISCEVALWWAKARLVKDADKESVRYLGQISHAIKELQKDADIIAHQLYFKRTGFNSTMKGDKPHVAGWRKEYDELLPTFVCWLNKAKELHGMAKGVWNLINGILPDDK